MRIAIPLLHFFGTLNSISSVKSVHSSSVKSQQSVPWPGSGRPTISPSSTFHEACPCIFQPSRFVPLKTEVNPSAPGVAADAARAQREIGNERMHINVVIFINKIRGRNGRDDRI